MATIKSYTDIEQSKKLAEILPLESVDMFWLVAGNTPRVHVLTELLSNYSHWENYHCWSLVALLNSLPNEISTGERYCDKYQIDIRKHDRGDNITLYQIAYGNNRGLSGSWHDMINSGEREELIDACYEMILKLNELKML